MEEKSNVARISFDGAYEDPSPYVVIHNPKVLSPALTSQVQRFGLVGAREKKPFLSGHLKGSRKAFTEMIQSYGISIEVIPAATPTPI
jgi:hypothetical protein